MKPYFFTKTGLCKQKIIQPISKTHILNEARLTLDYPVDLEVFTAIIQALYKSEKIFSLNHILSFLKKSPENDQKMIPKMIRN